MIDEKKSNRLPVTLTIFLFFALLEIFYPQTAPSADVSADEEIEIVTLEKNTSFWLNNFQISYLGKNDDGRYRVAIVSFFTRKTVIIDLKKSFTIFHQTFIIISGDEKTLTLKRISKTPVFLAGVFKK